MPDSAAKNGWHKHRFDEMALMVNDRIDDPAEADVEYYVGLEHLDSDSLIIRRWGSPSDVEATKLRFRTGDIIFGRRRVYQRKLAVAEFDGICSAHAMVLRAKTKVVLPEFLPFFMQSDLFMERAKEISVGSLSPTINWTTLAREEFCLPPLGEQARLAAALKATDSAITGLATLGRALGKVQSSLAHGVFSTTRWPQRILGDVLQHASDGPFGSRIKTEHYSNAGARVIRLQNIDINRFNDADRAFIAQDYFMSTLKSYTVKPGDVVVAGLGDDNIPAGRACVVPEYLGPAVNKADCFCLRPTREIDPGFLALFLNSSIGLSQSAVFSQGTTRLRLNLANIRRMTVPVPSLDTQRNITARLMALLEAEEDVAARREQAMSTRTRMLRNLLEEDGVV